MSYKQLKRKVKALETLLEKLREGFESNTRI